MPYPFFSSNYYDCSPFTSSQLTKGCHGGGLCFSPNGRDWLYFDKVFRRFLIEGEAPTEAFAHCLKTYYAKKKNGSWFGWNKYDNENPVTELLVEGEKPQQLCLIDNNIYAQHPDGSWFVAENSDAWLRFRPFARIIFDKQSVIHLVSYGEAIFLKLKDGRWFASGLKKGGFHYLSDSSQAVVFPCGNPKDILIGKGVMVLKMPDGSVIILDNDEFKLSQEPDRSASSLNKPAPWLIEDANPAEVFLHGTIIYAKGRSDRWYIYSPCSDEVVNYQTDTLIELLVDNKTPVEIIPVNCGHFLKTSDNRWFGSGENYYGNLGFGSENIFGFEPQEILINNEPPQHIINYQHITFMQMNNGDWYACGYIHDEKILMPNNTLNNESCTHIPVKLALPSWVNTQTNRKHNLKEICFFTLARLQYKTNTFLPQCMPADVEEEARSYHINFQKNQP